MASQKLQLVAFNRGLVDPRALARAADLKRVALSGDVFQNFMPRVLGSMSLRPGLQFLTATRSNAEARYLPFVFSTDDTALVEVTDSVARVLVDDELITRPAVTAAITNGSFTSDITGWTDSSEVGGAVAWELGGYAKLTGNGIDAAILDQQVIVNETDTVHAIGISVERGPVLFRVGSSSGGDEYVTEAVLETGSHSLGFTPTTGTFFVRFTSRLNRDILVASCEVESSGAMELATPWAAADLCLLRYDQSGDVIFVAAEGYQQRRIERRPNDSWSVVRYYSPDGPMRTLNVSATTITPSGITGNITLTASTEIFTSTNVGSIYQLISTGQEVEADLTGEDQWTATIRVTGVGSARAFTQSLFGTWVATVTLQQSVTSATGPWSDAPGQSWTSNTVIAYTDGLDNQIIWYRFGIKTGDYTSGTVEPAALSFSVGSITGYARVTAYTSATVVDAEVLSALGETGAIEDWSEGAWSDRRGWPTSVAFHEGRLWWAGQNGIWGSVSDAFDNFNNETEGDSAPISRTIGSGPVDTINWLLSLTRLVVGAEGAEFSARSSSLDEPLTPTNFNLRDSSTQGSWQTAALKIGTRGLFVQRGGIRVFELAIDSSVYEYASTDVSALVPAIGKPGIVCTALQRQPDTRAHFVRSDGTAAVLIYDSIEEVLCWVNVVTDGEIEAVTVLPAKNGESDDQVYYTVKRSLTPTDNIWSEANVLEYGGAFGTDVTAAGLEINNVDPPAGTNFCNWQGTTAAGRTHELRITPTTSVGPIRVIGHVNEGTLLDVTLAEGVESVLTINVPSTETGWRIISNTANIAMGTWACELYDITSTVKRYLEKWALEDNCIGATVSRQADSHIIFSNAPASTTVSGLEHLEGEEVVVWADGLCMSDASGEIETFTVSGGEITLTHMGSAYEATTGMVGLAYEARFRSGKLLQLQVQLGSAISSHKNISQLGLILRYAHPKALEFGRDFDNMDPMPEVEEGAIIDPDEVREDYDGEAISFPGSWGTDERLCLKATAPRPVYVLAAMIKADGHS